jgi:GNAT superfamily N-acetyltransferase
MSLPDWRERPIDKQHDRKSFDCGSEALNRFLREQARQSHARGGAKTFVATDAVERAVFGFYTLAPAEIGFDQVPETLRQGLGKYPIGGFRLARLAVDKRHHGNGLGGQLLLAAGRRCLRVASEIGGTLLFIDAKDARAAEWYVHYGAIPLRDGDKLALVMALATIADALKAKPG